MSGLRKNTWSAVLVSPLLTHMLVFMVTSALWSVTMYFVTHSAHSKLHAIDSLPRNSDMLPSARTSYPSPPMHGNFSLNAKLITCGHSTPEAKERGCRYDILSNHWVPGICMDEEAVAEYQADESWYGFADEDHTDILTIEEMGDQDFYYTNERDHIVHCAMLWRKQFRAFYEERPNIDALIANIEHTMHCSQFLIDMSDRGPDYRSMPIKTFVGHTGCWMRDQ